MRYRRRRRYGRRSFGRRRRGSAGRSRTRAIRIGYRF